MQSVVPAGESTHDTLANMMARAFHVDPAFSYIFPDELDRAHRLPRLFRLLLDSDGRAGMSFTTPGAEAATLWRAPGRARVGWIEMLTHAVPLVAALGGNAVRALRVSNAINAHMPQGSFWYLHIAACEPTRQGEGFGSAVIQAGLDRADRLPTYLETATKRNVTLYRRLGFAVTNAWRVGRDGPRFWSMMRP